MIYNIDLKIHQHLLLMSSEKIKLFNEILSSFLIQIAPLVGSTYHARFTQIIKCNNCLPIEQFLVHALPIRDQILNRDDTYFIDKSNNYGNTTDDKSMIDEILRLQNIYFKLDDTSKANVWDIFQALLVLGEEYISINQDKYK
jgi:hypothetical protein